MYIGKVYQNKRGDSFKILAYSGNKMTIEWQDDYKHQMEVAATKAAKGLVDNPYSPEVYGKGFIGVGKFEKTSNGDPTKAYNAWRGMLQRCYHELTRLKLPTYEQCTVATPWHNFQNFAGWFYENYKAGWEVDKDLLLKGNKLYSEDTCAMVPGEINVVLLKSKAIRGDCLIGVSKKNEKFVAQMNGRYLGYFETELEAYLCYKTHKEKKLKDLAHYYRAGLSTKAFQALIDYEVEQGD